MSDVFDKGERSQIMRVGKSKNTKSNELKLIQLFKENHITGWLHNYNVKGHPDFGFLEKRIAILWMVAFGMAMPAETLVRQIMQSIGLRSVNGISNETRKSQKDLKNADGR